MESEAYSDFVLLWLVCHVSRLEGERPHECWLERWSQEAEKQGRAPRQPPLGRRARHRRSRRGLSPTQNDAMRAALRNGELQAHDYYRELLRLVYRLLFLFAAEDRGLRPARRRERARALRALLLDRAAPPPRRAPGHAARRPVRGAQARHAGARRR